MKLVSLLGLGSIFVFAAMVGCAGSEGADDGSSGDGDGDGDSGESATGGDSTDTGGTTAAGGTTATGGTTAAGGTSAGGAGTGGEATGGTGNVVSQIYMFATDVIATGDLGGRTGADAACAAVLPAELAGMTTHAFIAVSDTDDLQDMPGLYGFSADAEVIDVAGNVVAPSYSGIISEDEMNWSRFAGCEDFFDAPLADMIVAQWPDTGWPYIVTGADPDGTVSEWGNCMGWSSDSADDSAGGDVDSTNCSFHGEGVVGDCSDLQGGFVEAHMLCLAF